MWRVMRVALVGFCMAMNAGAVLAAMEHPHHWFVAIAASVIGFGVPAGLVALWGWPETDFVEDWNFRVWLGTDEAIGQRTLRVPVGAVLRVRAEVELVHQSGRVTRRRVPARHLRAWPHPPTANSFRPDGRGAHSPGSPGSGGLLFGFGSVAGPATIVVSLLGWPAKWCRRTTLVHAVIIPGKPANVEAVTFPRAPWPC